jgi:hypothetical protein
MCHCYAVQVTERDVGAALERLWIGVHGATLRKEEVKKAREMTAFLDEVARARPRRDGEVVVVDAAAGKGYVGVLSASVLAPAVVHFIERDASRLAAAEVATRRAGVPRVRFEFHCGDVGDTTLWPDEPDLVLALHACGPAADTILDAAVRTRARRLLLVPCCTPARDRAVAEELGVPRHASVRRAFLESLVLAERTLRLEAAGFETEVVPFVAPTVTPHNLAYRARRVGERNRMRVAAERLARLSEHG